MARFAHETLEGGFPSWKEYLLSSLGEWIRLSEVDPRDTARITHWVKNLPETPSSLIHGDAINPSNILIREGKIIGMVDWEWSLIADPAWEFADIGWIPVIASSGLETYFQKRKIRWAEQVDFLERIKKYHILWLLWGTSLHRYDKDQTLYSTLKNLLHTFI